MSTNILMPALSPTMTEGTLSRWLKKEGEAVKAGDVLAEIETDKATMEVEAVDEGILGKIIVPDGTAGVAVNAPIAVLLAEGEKLEAPPRAPAPPPKVAPPSPPAALQPQASAAPASARPPAVGPSTEAPAAPTSPAVPAPGKAPAPRAQPNGAAGGEAGGRIFVSPLARRMAGQAGLALEGLKGTGPHGRIVKVDVEAALAAPGARAPQAAFAPAPAAAAQEGVRAPAPPAPVPTAAGISVPHRLIPHTTMRRVIARRLTESKQTIPHFYLAVDVGLDAALELRAELNSRSAKDSPKGGRGAFKLSVNDLIIKAAALALVRHPRVNATYTDEGIVEYEEVDISVAVAIPDGLITPIIRQADRKGLAAISNEMKDLAERAKAGKLKLEEFQGGGFSISNPGMFGISEFSAVINPPQAAILAIGAGEKRAVVRDGAVGIATEMTCTLSVDHRVIDGVIGSGWLSTFKGIIEDPLSLML
ncbi:MAG: pyruvate dehydrogenase complex dihydrolipoamide acetyltransferase [Acetobacteraceae bacterium]